MHRFTPVPNYIFDNLLTKLTFAETKVLLIVIRQTNGWVCKKTGGRKQSDRISRSQFMKKAGLSKRSVSAAIASLHSKGLLVVRNGRGEVLRCAEDRRGKKVLYYSFTFPFSPIRQYKERRDRVMTHMIKPVT